MHEITRTIVDVDAQTPNLPTRPTLELDSKQEDEGKLLLSHATTDAGAFWHVLKGSLGVGLMAMPFAFKKPGLVCATILAIIIGIVVSHATVILVKCSQKLCIIYDKRCLSFPETAEYAFKYGFNGKYSRFSTKAKIFVDFFLFVTYYGGSAFYVLFISKNIHQVLGHIFGWEINPQLMTLCLLPVLYCVGIVRLIKLLVPFSAIANCLLISALALIFISNYNQFHSITEIPLAKYSFEEWSLFVNMMLAGMEGIGPIMSIENEMLHPKHLVEGPKILQMGMVGVGFMTISVGILGYLLFGEDVKPVISLSLGENWISFTINFVLALVVLFSFGLQMTVSTKVIWDFFPSEKKKNIWMYYALRSVLIVGSDFMAIVFPDLGKIVSLVGAAGFSILGIFVPAVIELVLHGGTVQSEEDKSFINPHTLRRVKDLLLIIFALFCCVTGIYYTLLNKL